MSEMLVHRAVEIETDRHVVRFGRNGGYPFAVTIRNFLPACGAGEPTGDVSMHPDNNRVNCAACLAVAAPVAYTPPPVTINVPIGGTPDELDDETKTELRSLPRSARDFLRTMPWIDGNPSYADLASFLDELSAQEVA